MNSIFKDRNSNKYEAEQLKYEEAIELNLENKEFYCNKDLALFHLDRYQEAAEAASSALKIDADYQDAKDLKALALSHLGNIEFENKIYKEALQKYEEAIELNLENKEFYLNKALALFHLERYQEAAEAAGSALKIDADYQDAKDVKATTLNILGHDENKNKNYEAALAKYEEAIQLYSGYKVSYVHKAQALINLERYQEAVKSADKALQIDDKYQEATNAKAMALNHLGSIEYKNKNYKAALEKFEGAIKLNLGDKAFYINKAGTLIKLNRYKEALKSADRALEMDANFQETMNVKAWALNELGIIDFDKKDYQAALAKYEEAIHLNPGDIDFYNNKAGALIQLKRYKEACKAADKSLQIEANQGARKVKANALSHLGNIEYKNKNYQTALANYEEAIELNPEDTELYINKAKSLNELNKYQESFKSADKALQMDDKYQEAKNAKAIALSQLGSVEYKNKNYKAALEKFEEAIQLNSGDQYFYNGKAFALIGLKDYQEAVKSANRALKMDANFQLAKDAKAFALNQLGAIEYNEKNYGAALEIYEQAIELNPERKAFYKNKALALIGLNRYQLAAYAASRALELDNNYEDAKNVKASALNHLGDIEYNNNNFGAALKKYQQAIKLNPKQKVFYKNKSLALIELKRCQEAADAADQALKIDVNYGGAKNVKACALNHLGDIEYNNKNFEAALQKHEEAIELNPENKGFYYDRARALNKLKRYQEAAEAASSALQIDANYKGAKNVKAEALNYLGDIDYYNNNYQAALAKHEEAIELNPEDECVYYDKALALIELERYQEAAEAAGSALQIDSTYQDAKNAKAKALNHLGDIAYNDKNYQAALKSYEQALELNPEEKNFYCGKAKALIQLKRYQEAAEAAGSALQIDGTYQDSKNLKALALNHLGDIAYNDKNYQEALEIYEQAIELNSGKKVFYKNKALTLNKLGRYQEAAEAASSALQIDINYYKAKNAKVLPTNNLGNQDDENDEYSEPLKQLTKASDQGNHLDIVGTLFKDKDEEPTKLILENKQVQATAINQSLSSKQLAFIRECLNKQINSYQEEAFDIQSRIEAGELKVVKAITEGNDGLTHMLKAEAQILRNNFNKVKQDLITSQLDLCQNQFNIISKQHQKIVDNFKDNKTQLKEAEANISEILSAKEKEIAAAYTNFLNNKLKFEEISAMITWRYYNMQQLVEAKDDGDKVAAGLILESETDQNVKLLAKKLEEYDELIIKQVVLAIRELNIFGKGEDKGETGISLSNKMSAIEKLARFLRTIKIYDKDSSIEEDSDLSYLLLVAIKSVSGNLKELIAAKFPKEQGLRQQKHFETLRLDVICADYKINIWQVISQNNEFSTKMNIEGKICELKQFSLQKLFQAFQMKKDEGNERLAEAMFEEMREELMALNQANDDMNYVRSGEGKGEGNKLFNKIIEVDDQAYIYEVKATCNEEFNQLSTSKDKFQQALSDLVLMVSNICEFINKDIKLTGESIDGTNYLMVYPSELQQANLEIIAETMGNQALENTNFGLE